MLSMFYSDSENCEKLLAACQRVRERALGNEKYQISLMKRSEQSWYDDSPFATHICSHFGEEIGVYSRLYPHFIRSHPTRPFARGVELQAICVNAQMRKANGAIDHFFHATELILAKALRLTALNNQRQLQILIPPSRLGLIRSLELEGTAIHYRADGTARVFIHANETVLAQLGSTMPEPHIPSEAFKQEAAA